MISIIICSINPGQCEKTVKSINETIGAGYETIVFDNREKNWGICKVYNHCAEKAKHPYLCFAHEDVIIDVKDWGKEFIEFTERTPDCGVIGFAGGLQARRNFSCWWSGEKRMNVYDGFTGVKGNDLKSQYSRRHYSNPFEEKYSQALCIDTGYSCL
jgi:hypothetical protein